jgi:hypothetical protein
MNMRGSILIRRNTPPARETGAALLVYKWKSGLPADAMAQ